MTKLTLNNRAVENVLTAVMRGDTVADQYDLQDYEWPFGVVERAEGNVVEPVRFLDKNTLKLVGEEIVCSEIMMVGLRISKIKTMGISGVDKFAISRKTAKGFYETWLSQKHRGRIKEAKAFGFKSDPAYVFARAPFDPPMSPDDTPTWDLVFGNLTNTQALAAFIGSLFFPDSYRQQYCYIVGGGRNGKGSMLRQLERILGTAYCSTQPPKAGDNYWTHSLLDARLVCLPECENFYFVKSGIFKAITGGDSVHVEQKFKDRYTARLNCKFIITSNKIPEISAEESDQRRIIYCQVFNENLPHVDNFEERLWTEMPSFLTKCLSAFRAVDPNKPIPTDRTLATTLGKNFHEEYQAFIDRYYHFLPEAEIPSRNFVEHLREFLPPNLNKRDLKDMLRKRGVQMNVTSRSQGQVIDVYRGMTFKK